jgi:hypothetical protein
MNGISGQPFCGCSKLLPLFCNALQQSLHIRIWAGVGQQGRQKMERSRNVSDKFDCGIIGIVNVSRECINVDDGSSLALVVALYLTCRQDFVCFQ